MGKVKKLAGLILLFPVWLYRLFISPLIGASCRHVPTCSQYTIEAVQNTGPLRGFILSTNRILRCRPGGTHGYDPAPRIWIKRYREKGRLLRRYPASNRLKDHWTIDDFHRRRGVCPALNQVTLHLSGGIPRKEVGVRSLQQDSLFCSEGDFIF